MVNILTRAIMMSTPLLLGALAEVYAERTGMMICAIEGIFLIGAWGGFVGTYLSGSLLVGLLLLWRVSRAALYRTTRAIRKILNSTRNLRCNLRIRANLGQFGIHIHYCNTSPLKSICF